MKPTFEGALEAVVRDLVRKTLCDWVERMLPPLPEPPPPLAAPRRRRARRKPRAPAQASSPAPQEGEKSEAEKLLAKLAEKHRNIHPLVRRNGQTLGPVRM